MTNTVELYARIEEAQQMVRVGRLADAEKTLRTVWDANPDFAPAISGLAMVAMAYGNPAHAAAFFDKALETDANDLHGLVGFGGLHEQEGRADVARDFYVRATRAHPDNALGFFRLGIHDLRMARAGQAMASLDRAQRLLPRLTGQISKVISDRLKDCEWTGWDEMGAYLERAGRDGRAVIDPLTLMSFDASPEAIAGCARDYARRTAPAQTPMVTAAHAPGEKIRIAYLSADFHDHPVAHLIAGVFEAHDRARFELTAFAFGPRTMSPIRQRIIDAFDDLVDVKDESDEAIARMMAERKIDIAISMNGYTTNCRPGIMAHRGAPVQVNFQGYPGTMGAPYMDYLIADRAVIPEADVAHYDEKIVWMPNTYQPTDDQAAISPRTPSRFEEGLPEKGFVFMAYNRPNKISPKIFKTWMKILKAVDGSVLWLQAGSEESQAARRAAAKAQGVSPSRLIFARRTESRADHIARHRLADLFIDTLPYNAHSTASDALWAGLPVVTCRGKAFPGRVCAGLVEVAGFPELVTDSLAEYEALIVSLAKDRDRLEALHARVADAAPKSPLFDTAGYARSLEAAYTEMHRRSQTGVEPEEIDAAAL